jgi:hypothetical protein
MGELSLVWLKRRHHIHTVTRPLGSSSHWRAPCVFAKAGLEPLRQVCPIITQLLFGRVAESRF